LKRKLTDEQIKKIAYSYVSDFTVKTEDLASVYSVSTSTISNALHYAIKNCLVNEKTAIAIANKATQKEAIKRQLLGYTSSNSSKTKSFYEDLLATHRNNKKNISEMKELNSKYVELQHILNCFESVYSSEDECTLKKVEIERELFFLEEKLANLKRTNLRV
jgi:hypothetical protein